MKKKKILIVEDDQGISEVVKMVLKEAYIVKIIEDGNKAESSIKKNLPNLILMDLWMPGVDGAELTKKLKSNKATKNIPIILVSARNGLSKTANQVGADAFLTKPFNIKDLVSIVRRFIPK